MLDARVSLRPSIPRLIVVSAVAVLVLGTVPASADGGGTKTSQDPMLTPLVAGVTAEGLITVGELAGDDGYRFEAIRRVRPPRSAAPVPALRAATSRVRAPGRGTRAGRSVIRRVPRAAIGAPRSGACRACR